MSKIKLLSCGIILWSSIVHAQSIGEFDRVVGPRDKGVEVGSRDDWVVADLGQQVFLWRAYGASFAEEEDAVALPTAFWYDRESGELYQFHGTDFVEAVIQLAEIAPEISLDDIITADMELWNLWNSPATSQPMGVWSLVTYESLGLQPQNPIVSDSGEKRHILVDPCIPVFAPPGDGEEEVSDDDTKWQPATFTAARVYSLLETLRDDLCDDDCSNCSGICCNDLCCPSGTRRCCNSRCCNMSNCCERRCCAGPCCPGVANRCCNFDETCCGSYCCPQQGVCCPEAPGGCCPYYTRYCCPSNSSGCCTHGECCPGAGHSSGCCPEDTHACCGEFCCEESFNCCGTFCCGGICNGCESEGGIGGGTVTVNQGTGCPGATITFIASGVVDGGGTKRVQCNTVDISAVIPTYTWVITRPSGSTLSGSGTAASVVATQGGQYQCVFTVTVSRECPPEPITLTASASVPEYPTVEVQYKTFIAPSAISSPAGYNYFAGDNRWFGVGNNSSRSFQQASVTVNPAIATGIVGTPTMSFGRTKGYQNSPTGSDVIACQHCAGSYGDYCLVAGATPECDMTAVAGQNGNVLTMVGTRLSPTEIKLQIDLVGKNPCVSGAPTIDAHLTIHFRQTCTNGQLGVMEFRLYGYHDGFPWHELYINGVDVYTHDPCLTNEGPYSLFTDGANEHLYQTIDDYHGPYDGAPLDQWHVVPGQ
ncbi:MAG: hypothetical protein AABZ47_14340 [Planctomycetota bacterium]